MQVNNLNPTSVSSVIPTLNDVFTSRCSTSTLDTVATSLTSDNLATISAISSTTSLNSNCLDLALAKAKEQFSYGANVNNNFNNLLGIIDLNFYFI